MGKIMCILSVYSLSWYQSMAWIRDWMAYRKKDRTPPAVECAGKRGRQRPFLGRACSILRPVVLISGLFIGFFIAGPPAAAASGEADAAPADQPQEADSGEISAILTRIETRYAGSGVTARFSQTSTIKAMDITDTAEGKVFIKRPGRMRWEYESPEPQVILTDGKTLWIFRPSDNQVMTGKAPTYFGDGRGAGFLSDIQLIRKSFTVTRPSRPVPGGEGASSGAETGESGRIHLRLVPREERADLAEVRLEVSGKNGSIERIITVNTYGDETVIDLLHQQFDQKIDDAVFQFDIPQGADIVQLEG